MFIAISASLFTYIILSWARQRPRYDNQLHHVTISFPILACCVCLIYLLNTLLYMDGLGVVFKRLDVVFWFSHIQALFIAYCIVVGSISKFVTLVPGCLGGSDFIPSL